MTSVPPPHIPAAPSERDEPQWRIWMAPAAVAFGLGVGIIASILVGTVAQAGGSSLAHPTPAVSLISDVAFDLSFVFAALYFASLSGRRRPADFGFQPPRVTLFGVRPAPVLAGLIAMVVAGVSYYLISAVYGSLFRLHGSDKLPSELGVSKSTVALVGAAIFVCVIAPIAEEFFFRGFFFGALRRWRIRVAGRDVGTVLAAVITGILFGLAHTGSASSQYLIPLGFLGFVLCLLRWWTRSLYPCIALHSVNNALALGINQLHWNTAEILALIAASVLVIGVITVPFGGRAAAA